MVAILDYITILQTYGSYKVSIDGNHLLDKREK